MKLLSLNWFKSEKQKELEQLQVKEQELKNKILEVQLEKETKEEKPVKEPTLKPYKKVKLVNDILTVILNDGNIISKPNASHEDFEKVRASSTEKEVFVVVNCPKGIQEQREFEKKVEEAREILDNIDLLKSSSDFIVTSDNAVYMKPVETRSIPKLLVNEFFSILSSSEGLQSSRYQALKKFWLKCCLNPNAQSAEDLYEFLTHHRFKIDRHGNFYAYRRVKKVGGENKDLTEFISNTYNKIKGVWKKKPCNFYIYKDSENNYIFSKEKDDKAYETFIGNLEELYKNIGTLEENRFTSAHTGKEDYRVGEIISMPRHEGNDDNRVSCSFGFHAASKKYDYSGFGDTPILMIINPMDVLAVPKGEVGKLRTCRWYFAMTLPEEEKYILDDDSFDVTDLGDIFEEKCNLNQEYVQNAFAEEVKRHTFNLPNISATEIGRIVNSLDDMRNILSKRVVEV